MVESSAASDEPAPLNEPSPEITAEASAAAEPASEPVQPPAPEAETAPEEETLAEVAPPVTEPQPPAPAPIAAPEPAPEAIAAPEPEAAPPAAEPPVAVPEPAVAATLHVPASEPEPGEGGEWELLLQKLRDWFAGGQLQEQLQRYSGPVRLAVLLVAALLVLRIYGALISAIESLPLVPGLLELAGLVWLTRFSLQRLVRSNDREALAASLRQRWQAFRGKG
jgi:hypothetical protein